MLTIAAATMARDSDDRLASITLIAAQVDFAEAGELLLFVDESQIAALEDMMWEQGYLDRSQMAHTFSTIRSEDLIWSRAVRRYFLGPDDQPTDLGVWSTDTTRMPARMHSEYLRVISGEPADRGALCGGGAGDRAQGHRGVDVRGGDRDRPHRALAVGLQDPTFHGLRPDLRSDFGRAQQWHRQRARRGCAQPLSPGTPPARRALQRADLWLDRAETCQGSWWTEWTGC